MVLLCIIVCMSSNHIGFKKTSGPLKIVKRKLFPKDGQPQSPTENPVVFSEIMSLLLQHEVGHKWHGATDLLASFPGVTERRVRPSTTCTHMHVVIAYKLNFKH